MDDTTVQIITASVGVVGTLAAALLTQFLAARAEERRRNTEDQSRWLADRLRVNARFLAQVLSLERDLYRAAAQLGIDERAQRMPGYTSVELTPEEGLPGVFDDITRAILVEASEDAMTRLDALEELAAEITLIGTKGEAEAADAVVDALLTAVGSLQAYLSSMDGYSAILAAQAARKDFAEAAKIGLRNVSRKAS